MFRILCLTISLLLSYTAGAIGAPTTDEFMSRLVVCAGGIDLQIDARLLGSVRSVYEGDRTEGKVALRTQAAFLDKIPEKDQLAAFELYHKCIRSIIDTSYVINQETLDFWFNVNIPTDLLFEFSDKGLNPEVLLSKGNYFDYFMEGISIDYVFAKHKCNWSGIDNFNEHNNIFFIHGHSGDLYPNNISIDKQLLGQHFGSRLFFFQGRAWSGDQITFKFIPTNAEPLRSVESLVGKCMYVRITCHSRLTRLYIRDDHIRAQLEKYAEDTFKSIDLVQFKIKLSDTFRVELTSSNSMKVYNSGYFAVWEVSLPDSLDEFRIR